MKRVIAGNRESQSQPCLLELTGAQLSTASGGQSPTVTVLPWAFSSAGFTTVTVTESTYKQPAYNGGSNCSDLGCLFTPVLKDPVVVMVLTYTFGLLETITGSILHAVAAQARADYAVNAVKEYQLDKLAQSCTNVVIGGLTEQLHTPGHRANAHAPRDLHPQGLHPQHLDAHLHPEAAACSTVAEEAVQAQAEEDLIAAETPEELETALAAIEEGVQITPEIIDDLTIALEAIEILVAIL